MRPLLASPKALLSMADLTRLLQRRSTMLAGIIFLLCFSTYLTIATHSMLSTTEELKRLHAGGGRRGRSESAVTSPPAGNSAVDPFDDMLGGLKRDASTLLERQVERMKEKLAHAEKAVEELSNKLEKCKHQEGGAGTTEGGVTSPPNLANPAETVTDLEGEPPTKEVVAERDVSPVGFHGIEHPEYIVDPKGVDVTPVLIFAFRRVEKLKKCIDIVLRRMPQHGGEFRLFVSQDGMDYPEVTNYLRSLAERKVITHLIHRRDTSGAKPEEEGNGWEPYFAISHHYKFAIGQIFAKFPRYKRLILLEEDIEVGLDFFDMMKATAPLLDRDSTLYCVSGWSDNGKAGLVQDPAALYRSDFFPGLGWMMSRSLWEELGPIWPVGFWDDWMRQNVNRKNRACLRPEVTRTITWCDADPGSVSGGQFCEHMNAMKLVEAPVNWRSRDLSYLMKREYDQDFVERLKGAITLAQPEDVRKIPSSVHAGSPSNRRGLLEAVEVKMEYVTKEDFVAKAEKFNLMTDFKEGVPRTAYKGVVTFRTDNKLIHLVTKRRYSDP